ncbi:MAG: S41 family peptidase [Bacteroidia bacterium]|nr:S41 family peptidase [Bacteroidia bacterium]
MNKLFSFFFILLFSQKIICQNTYFLNSKTRSEIVNTTADLLKASYVFSDKAIKMSESLKNNLKKGKYNKITDPVQLADILTTDVLAINKDGHLRLEYNPGFFTRQQDTTGEDQRELQQQKRDLARNYGFKKTEILYGNIGYLELSGFHALSKRSKDAALASLKFLSNTKAIIIDMRINGGGSPEMVRHLLGYFFDKETHINDFYNRQTNKVTENWTRVDTSQVNFTKMPLYILASDKTASAAEEFCYDLQNQHRAIIIGNTTAGAAHPTMELDATNGIVLFNPYARAINPVTKTNWEGIGVKPEINSTSEKALETAHLKILDELILNTKDATDLFDLKWYLDITKCIYLPQQTDTLILKKYAGVFGERTITYENGKLFYQRINKPKFEMETISPGLMKAKNNNFFKVEFVTSASLEVTDMKIYYQDNRVETAKRSN